MKVKHFGIEFETSCPQCQMTLGFDVVNPCVVSVKCHACGYKKITNIYDNVDWCRVTNDKEINNAER